MSQEASPVGNGNTIVQIVGDGNSVTAGSPHLTLTRFVARRQIRQDLDRLSPYTRATPLLGREEELVSLHAFLNDPRPLSARVLIGGGGSGKTRLALELCEQVSAMGWNAGFIARTELRRFFDQQNLSAWGWQKPTLIVVDYAAEQAELLGKWLDELADRTAATAPALRLLLLERHASTDTGWWTTVFVAGGWGALNKRALLDPVDPIPIRPLLRADDRLALLQAMLEQTNPGAALRIPLHDEAFRAKLMQLTWGGDPLFLMMAALAMVDVGHARALTLGRTDLADALAEREADRLKNLAESNCLSPELVQHLAACVTLMQGMSREDFMRFASSEKTAIHRPSGGDPAALADVLQQALPRPDGIAPVLPDLIGEALIVRTLQAGAVLRCHAVDSHLVAETVIRCAQDFGQQSTEPLKWLKVITNSLDNDEDALAALAASLPMQSVVLSDLNLRVTHRLQTLRAGREDVSLHLRASTMHGLAIAQAHAGELEAALLSAQVATNLYRGLAEHRPDVYERHLARSLNNLANMLSALNQFERALLAAQEAANIHRELVVHMPDMFTPDLATSLHTLASRLNEMGKRDLALQAVQEAVDIRRKLAARSPDVFLPDLASSLNNVAIICRAMGGSASHVAQEAVDLYRELSAHRPDEFQSDLALACNTLAVGLSDMDQREAALPAGQEAVDLYRDLAALRPDLFLPNLAASLNNLALTHSDMDQREQALQAAQESANLYRELAAKRPDVFRTDLAMSLLTVARAFSELDQPEFALQAAQEAVNIYRKVAAQCPEVFRSDLAQSLIVMALRTHEAGRIFEAHPIAHEAIATLKPEFLRRPPVHARLMLNILRDYWRLCKSARQEPDLDLIRPLLPYLPNQE